MAIETRRQRKAYLWCRPPVKYSELARYLLLATIFVCCFISFKLQTLTAVFAFGTFRFSGQGRSRAAIATGLLSAISAYVLYDVNAYVGVIRRMDGSDATGRAAVEVNRYIERSSSVPWDYTDGFKMSWRVRLLPLLGWEDAYNRLNTQEPYDSKRNSAVLSQIDNPFGCRRCKSDVFCVRFKEQNFCGIENLTENILLVELPSNEEHWAAQDKDPFFEEFLELLERDMYPHHFEEALRRKSSGLNIANGSGKVLFVGGKLPREFWWNYLAPCNEVKLSPIEYEDINGVLDSQWKIKWFECGVLLLIAISCLVEYERASNAYRLRVM